MSLRKDGLLSSDNIPSNNNMNEIDYYATLLYFLRIGGDFFLIGSGNTQSLHYLQDIRVG